VVDAEIVTYSVVFNAQFTLYSIFSQKHNSVVVRTYHTTDHEQGLANFWSEVHNMQSIKPIFYNTSRYNIKEKIFILSAPLL